MLRIDVIDNAEQISFSLEGRLAGAWVAELERCWNTASLRRPDAGILVSLAGVSFVDDAGKNLLCRMRRNGVSLVTAGCLMKLIVDTIEADICKPEGEAV